MPKKIIHVVGRKNSGKTRLILKLLPQLEELGLKVATLKSDGGGHFDWDTEDKDTYKFFNTGSKVSGILSENQFAIKTKENINVLLDEIVKVFYKDVDIVLVEGFGSLAGNKIETLRNGISQKLISTSEELIATFGDEIILPLKNHFKDDAIHDLAIFLKMFISQQNELRNVY